MTRNKKKEFLCGLFFHVRTKRYTEDLPGKEFRYVSSCSCGKNKIKSIPLHDNDLLSNINISENNFPIDTSA